MHKHLYFFIFFLIFSFTSNSQSWKPFYKGDTSNFKFNNSVIVSHTIWVDSAKFISGDSVFYLNRVFLNYDTCLHIPGYLNCDTCFALDNQPQFLQRKIIKKDNGRYLLNDTSNLEIRTLAKLNDSWLFDAARGITATVVNVSLQTVFGINDSVKTIRLSNSDTIKLSKSFGFIQFPNLYGAGNYRLVGIENRHKGEKVPGFWEIFNFNVEDVFQYYGRYTNGGMAVIDEYVKKYYILTKTITTNKITYNVHRIQKGRKYWVHPQWGYNNPYVYNDYINLEIYFQPAYYQFETDKIINKFNKDLYKTSICGVLADGVVLKLDSLNIISKKIGIINSNNLLFGYVPYNNIPNLYHLSLGSVISGFAAAEYKVGLGRTTLVDGCFEIDRYEFMQGYIKNGDTVGVITPDGNLLGNGKDPQLYNISATFSPNPFSDYAVLCIGEDIDFPLILDIYNIQGKLIRTESISSKEFLLERKEMQNGIYFYQLRDADNNIIGNGKIIIQ